MMRNRLVGIILLSIVLASTALASEREVAEWVIRQGRLVSLEGERRPINDVVQLPAGEIRLSGIDLTGTLIDPKDLEKLAGLTNLKELYLPGPIWNPASGSRLDANEQLKLL